MHSDLTITTPAASLALLTLDETRAAAGLTDASRDAELLLLEPRIAAAITTECSIAIGRGAPPTLLRETLTEVFRPVRSDVLVLARRHEVEITSIEVNGIALDAADFIVNPESGLLTRLRDDGPAGWLARKVVVVYEAGFSVVPPDLKMSASDFFRLAWLERVRDPSVRGYEKEIPGVMRERIDHWVGVIPGQGGEGAVPDIVAGQLSRFRNFVVV